MKKYTINNLPKDLSVIVDSYKGVFGLISSQMNLEVFEAGETIISPTQPIDALRFMIRGRGKIILIHEDGKQSILHFINKEEYLGELTFLGIEKEHKMVKAITESIFVSVDMKSAKLKLIEDKEFLLTLSKFIGNKLIVRNYFNSKNQNYELKNRLAAYIVISQNNGIYAEKHTDTAEYLNVSYRHLLYTFKEFIDEGIITKIKKGYRVDLGALKKLSKDIRLI